MCLSQGSSRSRINGMDINIWSEEISYVGLLGGNSNNGCLHFGHCDQSGRLKASPASALKAWRIPGERLVFSSCQRLKKLESQGNERQQQWRQRPSRWTWQPAWRQEGKSLCFPQTSLGLGSLGENGWPPWGKVYPPQLSFPGNAQQATCTAGLLVGSRLTTSLAHSVVLNKASSQRVLHAHCNYYEGRGSVCSPQGGQIWLWINFDFKKTKKCGCDC